MSLVKALGHFLSTATVFLPSLLALVYFYGLSTTCRFQILSTSRREFALLPNLSSILVEQYGCRQEEDA
jgi:hypothetical protein